MGERTIAKEGRFVTIKRFCEFSGLSYATVDHLLKSGQVPFITTESGQRRIDTQDGDNAEIASIKVALDQQSKMLSALCQQFNTKM